MSHADYRRLSVACSGVAVVAFLLGNYYPALTTPLRDSGVSALGSTVSGLRLASDERVPTVYDAEERAFVREVKKVVPDDAWSSMCLTMEAHSLMARMSFACIIVI